MLGALFLGTTKPPKIYIESALVRWKMDGHGSPRLGVQLWIFITRIPFK